MNAISAAAALAATVAAASPVVAKTEITPAQARIIVAPLYQALNEPSKQDVEGLLAGSTTDDFKSCANPDECGGRDYLAKRFRGFGKMIPDLRWTIEEVWVAGDKVFVRGEASGTPVLPFFGTPPTGRSFKTMSLDMFVIRDGRMSFSYHVENWVAAIRQVQGEVPAAGQ